MKKLNDRIVGARVHLCCWAVWIAYEVLTTGLIRGFFSHYLFYLMFYPLNIGLFYLHGSMVMPAAFSSKGSWLWKLPVLVILELALYSLLSVMGNRWLHELGATASEPVLNLKFFTSVLWRAALFIIFGSGFYFLVSDLRKRRDAMQRALEIERLAASLVRAERDFLRSQINPHLLFNTLNFVKYAAKRNPELADEAVRRLSSLMGFAMGKGDGGLVELSGELVQVENIIVLNQLRFEGGLFIELEVDMGPNEVKIVPVVVLTLVENMFKHGQLRDSRFPAKVTVRLSDRLLEVETSNLCRAVPLRGPRGCAGTGLENIRSRLEIAYPGAYRFSWGMLGNQFRTSLEITVTPEMTRGIGRSE